MQRLAPALVLFMLSFFLATCKDMGTDPGPPPRLILGESADGVRFGDTPERVLQLLGRPDNLYQWDDGFYRTYVLWGYATPPNWSDDRLIIGFPISALDLETITGPVGVIWIRSRYTGKTREGLGIGSHLQEVLRTLGPPTLKVIPGGDVPSTYYFCCRKVVIQFSVRADTVRSVGMGPTDPSERFPRCE